MRATFPCLLAAIALGCATLDQGADASGDSVRSDASPSGDGAFDHSQYDELLKKHVKGDRVDYAALKKDRAPLDAYVDRVAKLGRPELEKLSRDEQMAFWINAYNAITLRSIVDAYPIEGSFFSLHPRNSIRQIDDVWTRKHTVASRQLSLDEIEHEILRKQWKDPRVHAAVNCASRSCAALRNEAYAGAKLDAQLDDATRCALADPSRNRIDPQRGKVELSKAFEWFGEDFGVKQDERAILDFVARYGRPEWKEFLEGFDPDDVDFLDYDWSLNDVD